MASDSKFHEGWAQHQMPSANNKDWNKYWLVLKGSMLFIFRNSQTAKDGLVGTLTLTAESKVDTSPSNKKLFVFDLKTKSNNGDMKVNRFKFDTENARDLWKAYLVGVATGVVPKDVHLMPGQVKDVHDAVGELHKKAPPLPNARNGGGGRAAAKTNGTTNSGDSQGDDIHSSSSSPSLHDDSDSAESLRAHPMTHALSHGASMDYLNRRQEDLARRMIHSRDDVRYDRRGDRRDSMHAEDRARAYERDRTQLYSSRLMLYDDVGGRRHSFGNELFMAKNKGQGHREVPSNLYRADGRDETRHSSPRLSRPEDRRNSNGGQIHKFYDEPNGQYDTPQWFFGECSRVEAEEILMAGRKYGSVLMRSSGNTSSDAKYVISRRLEGPGGSSICHYEVVRKGDGYKIIVENEQHSPRRTLSEVMILFVKIVGPSATPMTCNSRDVIFDKRRLSAASVNTWSSPSSPAQPTPRNAISLGRTSRRASEDIRDRDAPLVPPPPSSPPAAINPLADITALRYANKQAETRAC